MGYDRDLAERVRDTLRGERDVAEKAMFGGRAFLVDGHLAVSASSRGGLLVRVDPVRTEELLAENDVTRFEMRGRALDGWLHVGPGAVTDDDALRRWVGHGLGYARRLTAGAAGAGAAEAAGPA